MRGERCVATGVDSFRHSLGRGAGRVAWARRVISAAGQSLREGFCRSRVQEQQAKRGSRAKRGRAKRSNRTKMETMMVAPPGPEQDAASQMALDPVTQSTAETWLSIASLAETLGDADRAAMAYDATLQYNQASTKALTSLAHLYRSRDMFQKAAELYERALAVNPELSDVWATLGHCYLMLDDLQRAYNAYQQALYHLSNPNVPKLWHGIGILYDRYGSLDYAEEAFAKVLELDPHFEKANEIYFRLGIIYKHQGKWNQALECFRYILPAPPAPLQEWDIWFQLGSVLENMGEWHGAREAYEHVLLQNEHHAKVLQQLGCLYGMNTVQFYDPQKALNFLLKSLEVDPSDATTWYHLGRVHMIRSDYTAAYDAFQQAVNRDSRNPIFWCSIGVLYYQISQYRDALDAYTRAIRLNPYISEVWYDLGTLYETCNNQLTDALDAYKQAARLDPENVHIRERLEALTQQLADNGAQAATAAADGGPAPQMGGPPPIMLQPTLQSTDQSNPLNVRPAGNPLYTNAPLPQYAVAVPQQTPPTMLPPPPQHQAQPMYHQPMIHPSQPSMITNVKSANAMGPMIPQKRLMDGSIHTLVNAAVSTVANDAPPTQAAPAAAAQVPTLPTSQKTAGEPQQKKLKTKKSPKAAMANLKIRSTTIKDKEQDREKITKHRAPSTAENSATVTAPASAAAPEVPTATQVAVPETVKAAAEEAVAEARDETAVAQTAALEDIVPPVEPAEMEVEEEMQEEKAQEESQVPHEQPEQHEQHEQQEQQEQPEQPGQQEQQESHEEQGMQEPQQQEPQEQDTAVTEPETVIKPSAEAIEKLQEEAKLREEEERERLEVQPQPENSSVARENVVRQIEEDENYDD